MNKHFDLDKLQKKGEKKCRYSLQSYHFSSETEFFVSFGEIHHL